MLPGIDVSDYQGTVDWGQVAQSGELFAIAKATEGIGFTCRTFRPNWGGIRAAGLVRGAYHFARPDDNAPDAEAEFFLDRIDEAGGLEDGDLLALDLERGSGNLRDWALAWLRYVTERVGFRPLLYSGLWFMEPHGLTGDDDLAQYGLWLASYSIAMPEPPPNWPFFAFWQHTDAASVPGIAGPCDHSLFNGDIQGLCAYGSGAAPAA